MCNDKKKLQNLIYDIRAALRDSKNSAEEKNLIIYSLTETYEK